MLRRIVAAGAVGLGIFGCGGSTSHYDSQVLPPGNGGSASAGSAGSSAGSAAGTEASGGTGGVTVVDTFDTVDTFKSPGLWMGFPDDELPIGTPPVPQDGPALHLAGTTDAAGLDVYFHTAAPIEKMWPGVRFWVQSAVADAKLTVAIAGPGALYFDDRAKGVSWPERVLSLSEDWQEVVVNFEDLGVDAQHPAPHAEMYGAFHFIVEPHTDYDLWIDDFAGVRL